MGGHLHLATHLSVDDLEQRYCAAHEPHERTWWQILWLLAKGQTATAVADSTGSTRVRGLARSPGAATPRGRRAW
jgi:hypothetical protein